MAATNSGDTSNELREDVPLKAAEKRSRLCDCGEECLGGSKFINIAFGVLTVVITVALLVQIYYGDYQVVPHGSVATDNLKCSEIGTFILKKGGNSVDAAIASAFCMAVIAPHITGLDAEGELMIYNHRTRTDPTVISFKRTRNSSGPLPKLVLGLANVHQHYGSLRWKDLVVPSAELARNGFPVSKSLAVSLEKFGGEVLFQHVQLGELLRLDNLAHTLDGVAQIPEEDLYDNGTSELQIFVLHTLKVPFRNYNIFMPNFPASGPILSAVLRYMESNNVTHVNTLDYIYYFPHIIRTVYEDFNITNTFHRGTSTNIAVMDLDDNYVSLVTGMSAPFGSKEMTDYGYITDTAKNLPCTRLPLIVVDSKFICGKRMVLGASDPAQAAQVLASLIIGSPNVTLGIEAPRFDMFLNGSAGIEDNHSPKFSEETLRHLETAIPTTVVTEPYDSSNIVAKRNDELSSHSDSRGGGIASRF